MSDLVFDRIVSITSENDKNTVLQIGVYQGNASATVWASGNNRPLVKIGLPRATLTYLKEYLQKILISKPGERYGITFTKWDQETKKSNQLGTIYIGRDDKAIVCLAVQAVGVPPAKFPLKVSGGFDSSDPMTDVHRSELAARTLIDQLSVDIPVAIQLTSVKRDIQRGGNNSQNSKSNDMGSIF